MAADLVVGVDLGTTALKAGLFDADGRMHACGSSPYPIERARPEWAEQQPEAWLSALGEVLESLADAANGQRVRAVGICGQVNTHVFVDEAGAALRPAITWQDQRCGEIALELSLRLAEASPAASSRFGVSSSTLPARAAWIAREEPAVWAATRHVLSPKDFVSNVLCRLARPVTDPITPFDVVGDDGAYDADVIALVDGLAERLPAVQPIDAVVGTVAGSALPLIEGATVVTGTMDAWGSVYGSGVTEHGDAMEVAGTSEILALLSRERRPAAGVVTFLEVDGLYLHAGPTQAGGAALAWFAEVAGLSVGDAIERAGRARAGAGGLIFMPHLLGERAPIWDSDMRGAFIGLSSEHTIDELCRAVLEGVAYSARHLLESLEQAGGVAPPELRASGGGSQSDLWCQIKADVLERPIARVGVRESGCLGAALMAASGVGLVESVRGAAREQVRIERVFAPAPARGVYDELYPLYRELQRALEPIHGALGELRRRTDVPST
ncbi:MAG: xylulokinase [Gaiellales bacterium]|jgi:xylulokinase|nr:xylulokinase [Gaiellales bacterium]